MKKLFAVALLAITSQANAVDLDQYIGMALQDYIDSSHYRPIKSQEFDGYTVYLFGFDRVMTVADTQCNMNNSYNMVKGYGAESCPAKQTTIRCRWSFKVVRAVILDARQLGGC